MEYWKKSDPDQFGCLYTGELLPLGSIVILENSNHKLLIYGRMQVQKSIQKEWDCVACLYPFGYINDEYTIFFNHESIFDVIFKGFEDMDEIDFRRKTKEY